MSFCWTGASDNVQINSKPPRALIATEDGRIWSISLQGSEGPAAATRNEKTTARQHSTRVTIEINDSEDEDIELWNDEDGLLESSEKLDSLTPATKRQRISSPLPPPNPSPSLPNNQDGHTCVQVNTGHHLVGSEVRSCNRRSMLKRSAKKHHHHHSKQEESNCIMTLGRCYSDSLGIGWTFDSSTRKGSCSLDIPTGLPAWRRN